MCLFVIALSLAGAVIQGVHRDRQNQALIRSAGGALSDDIVRWITMTVGTYEYGLRGARGAVVSAGGSTVRWDLFAAYASTRDHKKEFPGARGFGFVRRVAQADQPRYVERMRAEGRPGFSVWQLAPHAGERFVIEFIEPLQPNRAAVGLDLASEARRRSAAIEAMRSGNPVMTAPITLVQADAQVDRGVLVYLPVFHPGARPVTEDEREAATFGWVFLPLVVDEFLQHAPWLGDRFHLALSDVTDPSGAVRFWGHSEVHRHDDHPLQLQRRLTVMGRTWRADVALTPRFIASLNLRHPVIDAAWIAAAGGLLALLLYLHLGMRERERREFVRRAWQAAIVEGSDSAVVGCGLDGRITSWNPAASKLFGFTQEQARGRTLPALLRMESPDAVSGLGESGVRRCRHHDGAILDVWISRSPVHDIDGREVGTAWTLRDVTRQRVVELTVRELMKLGSALEGEDFIDRAIESLCRVLGAAYVFVARLEAGTATPEIRVASAWGQDGRHDQWRRLLAGTPCELMYRPEVRAPGDRVTTGGEVVIPSGVSARFEVVRDSGFQAFIGVPMPGHSGAVVGHLAVFFNRCLEEGETADLLEVSRLFGHRVQAEMQRVDVAAERDRAMSQLRHLNQALESEARARAATLQRLLDVQRAILGNAGYAIVATDAAGRVTVFNAAAEAMLGYPAQEVIGLGLETFHDASEMTQRMRDLERELGRTVDSPVACLAAKADMGLREEREWTYVRKDGSRFPVMVSISALRDRDGSTIGYLAIAIDLSERRRLERALTAERDRFRTTLNVAPSVILTVNQQGLIEHANARVENVFGYTPEEVEGKPVEMLMDAGRRQAHGALRDTFFQGSTGARLMSGRSVLGRHRDGHSVPIEVRLSLFQTAEGPKTIAIATDRSAQELLVESEQRWRNMANYLPQLVWTCTAEGECDFLSRQWAEYTGLPEDGRLAAGSIKQVHPDDRKRLAAAWRRAVETGGAFQDEYRIRRHDGVYRWFDTRATALRDDQGRVLKWIGANTDIEDRKAAESQVREINANLERRIEERTRALEESRRDLRNILDAMPNIVCYWDRDLRSRFANTAYEFWFGVNPAANGLHYDQALGPDLVGRNRTYVEGALRGEIQHFVRDIPAPDGTLHSFDVVYLPDRVEDRVQGFYSISSDVTEERRAKEMAEAAQRNLQNILDAMPSMVGYWDRDLHNRFANEAYRAWFGLDPKTLSGKHMSEVFGPELYQASLPDVNAALSGERRFFERQITSRSGEIRIALATYLPDIVDGEVRGFYALSHDITDVRRAQEAAEAASAAKTTFLANMSHEIRTPLNGVLGMLQLLTRSQLEPTQQAFVEKASAAARTLLGILNDVLDFSKIEAGKLVLDPQPFALDEVLSEIGVLMAASRGHSPIEIIFDVAPDVPWNLVGDALRLKQILINLGGNALKFTARGEVVLRVDVRRSSQDQVHLEFSVRDSGIGMTPDQCRRVFDGFVQAEASTTRRFGGTGLGLAITQRLILMMGGELNLQSELGKGSTFRFVLPFERGIATPERGAEPALRDALPSAPRILLMEDHPETREVLARQMRGFGWTVDVCVNADALTEAQRTTRYDVAVVDWPPQGTADVSALERLQARNGMEIIGVASNLLSARVDSTPTSSLRLHAVLAKPVIAPTLFDAVLAACARDRSAHDGAAPTADATASRARRPRRLEGLRLLVVEDNPTNQLVAQGLLAGEGAHVTLAGGGLAGVEAVERSSPPFDLVLMDLQMPDIDGFEATARIRRLPGGQSLPVVAMTANAMASDRETCLRSGMDDHVPKPIDIGNLVQVILRCTARNASAAASAATPPSTDADVIDVAGAVERMGGHRDIYLEVLASALEDMPRLHARLSMPDAAPALARAAHTIKGLAGTVGADRLREAAWRVESELKERGQCSEAARTALDTCMAQALGALRQVLETSVAADGPGTANARP